MTSIGSLGSAYQADIYNKTDRTDKLEDNLSGNLSSKADEELMEVCKDFEAYFTEQVFKAMKKMVPESGESSSSITQMSDYMEDSLYQNYAEAASDGEGMGIAQTLYDQMKRNSCFFMQA
ncbi:rod-binding protein [Anaerobium acetethylicum]|uniref:Flagellar protein FlgJ n=1 Tax=Anaerobium acetethylicum TaxID=1619234 RepID=A0A1D3TQB3_9FIRM|nr:rod-binding protein [Anaerobium acetethylicum]SCP95707.1 flagellar protein FlgJ [Anaerobium acetethylicum]